MIRELSTTDDASIDIRRVAKSASNIIKKKCGPETFNENCSLIQRNLNARRALRKKASLLQVSLIKCYFFIFDMHNILPNNIYFYSVFTLYSFNILTVKVNNFL